MSDATIKYNGSTIASVDGGRSVTLATNGKYMTSDVIIEAELAPSPVYQSKTVSAYVGYKRIVTADAGYDALSEVTINAIGEGTAGTPVATKVPVSNHSVTITPSVSNVGGYINSGVKTGSPVTVNASELVSGTLSVTSNDTGIDVTNYKTLDVNVPVSGGPTGTKRITITENGTTTEDVTNYATAEITVDVGSSGGGAAYSDVNFYDYDGNIVWGYTADEFAALNELPSNPSHEGLTAQGWNWSLADAKTYVASYGKLNIGQMYITDDGKTRIYIHLEEPNLSPYLGICPKGYVDVDWGDDSPHDTVNGTSTTAIKNTQHVYSAPGDYVIVLTVSGTMNIVGTSSAGSRLLYKNAVLGNENIAYQSAIRSVAIGSGVTIGAHAFRGCYKLSSLTLPNEITSIGEYTFINCYSLLSLTIPYNVRSIGLYTFQNCYGLSSLAIPKNVTSISSYAFTYCYSLSSISIPSNVTGIGSYDFNNCYSLTSITIPESVTSIGTYVFQNCYKLSSLTIPDSVRSIAGDAFRNCYSLSSLTIPESVTSIESDFAYGCGTLSSLTIPEGVTSIKANAFRNCYSLGFIKFKGSTPPTVAKSSAWTGIPTDCKIYVPAGSLAAYTSATNYPSSSTYTYVEY